MTCPYQSFIFNHPDYIMNNNNNDNKNNNNNNNNNNNTANTLVEDTILTNVVCTINGIELKN